MKNKLSVVVCTKDRPKKLIKCLKSILATKYGCFELIVINQSRQSKVKIQDAIKLHDEKVIIRQFFTNTTGLSKARNLGIKKSKSEVVVFTDDDCIVPRNWLGTIIGILSKYKNIDALFGQSLPYIKSKTKGGYICPSVVNHKHRKRITKDNFSSDTDFPTGNNMVIKRKVFSDIGLFCENLGVGSKAGGGEETEMILRMIYRGKEILYTPQLKIWHDRWLSQRQYLNLMNTYLTSVIAVFFYYLLVRRKLIKIPQVFVQMIGEYLKVTPFSMNTIFYKVVLMKKILSGLNISRSINISLLNSTSD